MRDNFSKVEGQKRRESLDAIIRLDDALLLFFTKISHRFQRLTGRTNFFLAKLCLYACIIGLLINIASYWVPLIVFKINLLEFIIAVLFVIFLIFQIDFCDKSEETVFSGKKVKIFNI